MLELINVSKSYQSPTAGQNVLVLNDINLKIENGKSAAVVGPSGSGKSTLLKILSRVTEPTEGTVMVRGRVGSLLEVGTGFHPELTGRENIYMNGAILGMKRNEIDKKFDEMVDFSEVGQFIDTPVKRYSSGMYLRLAFAVAAHLEPEILVVDEVLAVGDQDQSRPPAWVVPPGGVRRAFHDVFSREPNTPHGQSQEGQCQRP